MAISTSLVILNLFQDLQGQCALVSPRMLKQVQHDDIIPETIHA